MLNSLVCLLFNILTPEVKLLAPPPPCKCFNSFTSNLNELLVMELETAEQVTGEIAQDIQPLP